MQVYSASANEFIWASVHSRDGEGLMMSYGDRMRWLRLADEGTHRVVRRFVGVGQHVQVERHFQFAACLYMPRWSGLDCALVSGWWPPWLCGACCPGVCISLPLASEGRAR